MDHGRGADARGAPHYTTVSPIEVYAVTRQARVDLIGDDSDNDDEYDLRGLAPVCLIQARKSQ